MDSMLKVKSRISMGISLCMCEIWPKGRAYMVFRCSNFFGRRDTILSSNHRKPSVVAHQRPKLISFCLEKSNNIKNKNSFNFQPFAVDG